MAHTSILILGAGELGLPVIRHFAQHAQKAGNTTVTVLLRPATIDSQEPEKKQTVEEIRALGVQLLAADLAAPADELVRIFRRFDAVISCTGYGSGAGGFQLKLAHAVLDAGVKRYFPWQFGVDFDVIGRGSAQDLFDEQLDVRALLRSQHATKWVIVSTGMFTSYLFEPFFGVVDLGKKAVQALGSWDTAVTLTTPEDIGRLTAEIFFAEPPIEDRIVYIGGDTVTYGQVADLLESLVGHPITRTVATIDELRQDLQQDPTNFVKKYQVIFGAGRGVAWQPGDTFNAQQGIATTSAKQWAEAHLRA